MWAPYSRQSSAIRSTTMCGVRACRVHIEPPSPFVITRSIGTTSAERTSPTMIRERVIRSAAGISSPIVSSPAERPSTRSPLPSRASIGTTCFRWPRVCSQSSNSDSRVPIRSSGGISAAIARSRLVLPTPCVPVTITFFLARIAEARKAAKVESRVPSSTRSASVAEATRWRRIATYGRGVTSVSACSRMPPSRRSASVGLAVERLRSPPPCWRARSWSSSMSSSSVSATGGTWRSGWWTREIQTSSQPLIRMFSISGSSRYGCSRPARNSRS